MIGAVSVWRDSRDQSPDLLIRETPPLLFFIRAHGVVAIKQQPIRTAQLSVVLPPFLPRCMNDCCSGHQRDCFDSLPLGLFYRQLHFRLLQIPLLQMNENLPYKAHLVSHLFVFLPPKNRQVCLPALSPAPIWFSKSLGR